MQRALGPGMLFLYLQPVVANSHTWRTRTTTRDVRVVAPCALFEDFTEFELSRRACVGDRKRCENEGKGFGLMACVARGCGGEREPFGMHPISWTPHMTCQRVGVSPRNKYRRYMNNRKTKRRADTPKRNGKRDWRGDTQWRQTIRERKREREEREEGETGFITSFHEEKLASWPGFTYNTR